MALLKEGLWGIVQGTEVAPGGENAAALAKFIGRRDKALATLGLSIDPTLLYLLDGIDDPKAAWKKLHDQYCKKTWANKLELRKKLHSLKPREGGAVQEHFRQMTELSSGYGRDGLTVDRGGQGRVPPGQSARLIWCAGYSPGGVS